MKGGILWVLALAVAGGGSALAAISNTKHNLGTTGTGANHVTSGTDELCVFCHTPHAANTSVAAPLWNKNTPSNTYTTYASTTIDGETNQPGSVSLACLSCHDGTQAMDNIINAPGSGGLTADGGGADGLSYTWASGGTIDAGGFGRLDATIANLGVDLSNDHPISIQYGGGGVTGCSSSTTTPGSGTGTLQDVDFNATSCAQIGAQTVWWVDTSAGTAAREKTDMILYTRSDFSGAAQEPSVECASCHDPHSENATFLRVANTGSAVCLACHDK